MIGIIALDQYITIRVWINGKTVERVEPRGSVEHILIHLSILASQ